jgi:chromosome segregation ATPase
MAISRSEGFVDLRVSPSVSGRSDEDSVWPSFTDIMTVVVLIFLVSLVVILMRNTELVAQLSESVSQKQVMTTQQGDLELRIASLGDEIVHLRVALDQTETDRLAAEQKTQLKEGEISALLDDVSVLKQLRAQLTSEKATLAEQKAGLGEQLTTVTGEKEQLTGQKAALLITQQELTGQVESLQQTRTTLEATRETLQGEVAELAATRDRLTSEKATLAEQKAGLGEQLTTVTGEKEQLTGQKAALLITQQELTGQVESLQQTRTTLGTDIARLQGSLSAMQAEQAALTITAQAQAREATSLAQARDDLSKERDELTTQVTLLEVTRAVLQTETSALRNELEGLLRTAVSTERALEESKLTGEDLAVRLAETALDYKLTKEELAYLRAEYTQEVGDFEKQRRLLIAAHQQELDILRERHSDLEVQYNRLIRPARSTVGRHVVEVRFWKEGSEYHYSLREPGQAVAQSVSVVELHQVMAARKAQYGDKLYTKVKFPNENSITQGEAWRFTVEMHNRYDYYYQN